MTTEHTTVANAGVYELRDQLAALNAELVEALKQGLALWPGAADGSRPVHPDVRMFVNAARRALAKVRS